MCLMKCECTHEEPGLYQPRPRWVSELTMTEVTVLPSREISYTTGTVKSNTDGRVFVEEWLQFDEFEERFFQLEAFGDEEQLNTNRWIVDGISFWRPLIRELYDQNKGNLKYILPFAAGLDQTLKQSSSVELVWPQDDVFVTTARAVAKKSDSETSFSITIQSDCIIPIPNQYYGDDDVHSSTFEQVTQSLKAVLLLSALQGIILIGALLPSGKRPEVENLLVEHPSQREITEVIADHPSITLSLLRPRLIDLGFSVLGFGKTECEPAVYLEDFTTARAYSPSLQRRLISMIVGRAELIEDLEQSLQSQAVPALPREYLEAIVFSSVTSWWFIKRLVLTICFDNSAELDSLIQTSDSSTREFYTELGKQQEVTTVDLHHSALVHDPPEIHNNSDVYVVKGHPEMDYLQSKDIYHEELWLTGRPYMDRVYEYDEMGGDRSVPQIFDFDGPTGVVATEPLRDDHKKEFLQRAFDSEALSNICLKLHPQESESYYEQLLTEIEDHDIPYEIVSDQYPLFDILDEGDIVVTVSSNVGLEALAMGTPALHTRMPCYKTLYYQTTAEFAEFVTTPDRLSGRIDQMLSTGPDETEFEQIAEWFLIDGQCSERFLSKIEELIQK